MMLVSTVVLLCLIPFASSLESRAWVTVVFAGTNRDTEYYEGARVALASVKGCGSSYDRVALMSQDVPVWVEQAFQNDGVIVIRMHDITNPYQPSQKRFKRTLNKLAAWSDILESRGYERVVLIDADVLVLSKADEIFDCGSTCVAFINPTIFHTGVVVLTPSNETFNGMLRALADLPSYDGADQGFLNSFFNDALAAPLFDPAAPVENPVPRIARLPFCYSLDHFYFYQRFRWEVNGCEPKIMTFPSVPRLKPWYWYSWPLLDLTQVWHEKRRMLGESQPYAHFIAPFCLLMSMAILSRFCCPCTIVRNVVRLLARRLWILAYLLPLRAKSLKFVTFGIHDEPTAALLPVVMSPLFGWSLYLSWVAALTVTLSVLAFGEVLSTPGVWTPFFAVMGLVRSLFPSVPISRECSAVALTRQIIVVAMPIYPAGMIKWITCGVCVVGCLIAQVVPYIAVRHYEMRKRPPPARPMFYTHSP